MNSHVRDKRNSVAKKEEKETEKKEDERERATLYFLIFLFKLIFLMIKSFSNYFNF